nr:hypothetical protein BaRGS_020276 [Batillaria attramentaria]
MRNGMLLKSEFDVSEKKDEAEAPEKEAKERHEKAWEEYKAERQAEKDRVAAIHAFAELDINSDRRVDLVEMQRHMEFDIDSDGTVSDEEAREYLDDSDSVELEKFQERIWANIKDIYKPPQEAMEEGERQPSEQPEAVTPPPPPPQATPVPPRGPDSYDEDDDDYEDEDEDDDRDYYEEGDDEGKGEDDTKPAEEEEKMPPYDEETQKLIDAADAARKEYNDADQKVRDAENEINGLKKYLEVDYGPDEEFSSLRGQCFEYTDREYTYKLCPFDRAVQKPKAGGIETSLGKWGHWYGPEEDKYDAMKYENGQSCWNGPNRSCHV